MSEASGKEEQVKNPGRRKFLIRSAKLAAAGVGAAALGGIVANEVINKREGSIVTESGTFFPLYEDHTKGIKAESIPSNLDVFFRETGDMDTFSPSPEEVLRHRFTIPDFQDKVLASLSRSKAEVMIGDVETPFIGKIDPMIMVGEAMVGGALALKFLRTLRSKENSEVGISRRKFLQAVMLAGAAWGLSRLPVSAGTFQESYNENAIDRVYSRFVAIESHMHPELSIVFFRNIIMADKLLTVSEDIRKRTGQKAKIAFQVGSGHAGIEDFLQAGHDFCRGLVLAYPKQYLRSTVELNNGIRDFCSSRLFKLPENLTIEDIGNGEKLKETTERRVVDEKLEKALIAKLA